MEHNRKAMTQRSLATYPSLLDAGVVISGGASGIGAELVRQFANQGAKVGFVDLARPEGEALENELRAESHSVLFRECDVTDVKAYQAAIKVFEQAHGSTACLVNNAAHDQRQKWDEVTEAFWDSAVSVNLKHAFFAAQAVVPGMIQAGRGSIINLGSISWMTLTPDIAAYASSKAAMHGMSRTLAKELGKYGIRVNTLVPGWVMTERQLTNWVGPKEEELIDQSQALKGRVYTIDIARMALFLASDDSLMISGQDFIVDGGWAHG